VALDGGALAEAAAVPALMATWAVAVVLIDDGLSDGAEGDGVRRRQWGPWGGGVAVLRVIRARSQ
jgi:hypothetical protein